MIRVTLLAAAAVAGTVAMALGLGALRARGHLPADPHGVLLTVCAAFAVLQWVVSTLILLTIRRALGEVISITSVTQTTRGSADSVADRRQK